MKHDVEFPYPTFQPPSLLAEIIPLDIASEFVVI
jgi:hypothetical protein